MASEIVEQPELEPATAKPTTTTTRTREYKRERKLTAQVLPIGITHNMMRKYVVYYREMTYLKNGKQQPREYFKVEAHPKLNKPWITSKSVKISLIEKLKDANTVVDDLENDIYPGCITAPLAAATAATAPGSEDVTARWIHQLPKYATMRIVRDTPTSTILSVIYDRKDNLNGFRWTGSHTFYLPTVAFADNAAVDAVIFPEIHKLKEKLREKYGVDLWGA